jgi:hypothetical protein
VNRNAGIAAGGVVLALGLVAALVGRASYSRRVGARQHRQRPRRRSRRNGLRLGDPDQPELLPLDVMEYAQAAAERGRALRTERGEPRFDEVAWKTVASRDAGAPFPRSRDSYEAWLQTRFRPRSFAPEMQEAFEAGYEEGVAARTTGQGVVSRAAVDHLDDGKGGAVKLVVAGAAPKGNARHRGGLENPCGLGLSGPGVVGDGDI